MLTYFDRHPPEAPAMATLPPGEFLARVTGQKDLATTQVSPHPIRLMIVDDHIIVRNGIVFSLLAFPDIEVYAQASTGEEALRFCAEADDLPDVVLMDLIMPGMGGVAAIQEMHTAYPQIHIVALSSFQDGGIVEETLRAGALGFLTKDVAIEELASAIRQASRGAATLASGAAQALVRTVVRRPRPLGYDLTDREREVLGLLAEGMTNKQIAEKLVITEATVKFHARSIRSKLGASSRTEMVVMALNHHLVPTLPAPA